MGPPGDIILQNSAKNGSARRGYAKMGPRAAVCINSDLNLIKLSKLC